jgi:hypothetical protein
MAASSLSSEDKERLQELAEEENALKQEIDALRDRYAAVREDAPSLPSEPGEEMARGSTRVGDASGECSLGDAQRAQTPAAEGRAHLEKARDGISQAKDQMGRRMSPGPGGMTRPGGSRGPGSSGKGGDMGPNDPKADVKIPGEDEHEGPKEDREEILKAMKENSPEEYKNLNRDYYERLVK